MSKVAIIGDTHQGLGSQSDHFHRYFSKSFQFMFDYMEKHGIKNIIQTGDLFDRRKEVHFNTLYQSNKYFFDPMIAMDITMFVICGNHDSLFKSSNYINSVSLLKKDNWVVVDMSPQTIVIDGRQIDFYPWINDSNARDTFDFYSNTSSRICVGHFEFAKFPMHPGSIAEEGMSHTRFEKYTKVISGHYHTQSQTDNVHYVGTPYELTWIDHDDPKGFWVLDTDTLEMEFVRNPHTMFEKVEYHSGLEKNFDFSTLTDKFVKVIVSEKESDKALQKFLDKANEASPIDVKVIDKVVVEAVHEAVGIAKTNMISTQAMIESVVDGMDIHLNKARLKRHVVSTYSEAMAALASV